MTKAGLLLIGILAALGALLVSRPAQGADAQALLDLSQAVTEALEKNPEIQTLRERLGVVSARAKQAPYLEDPQIAFQLGGVPLSNPTSFNQADANSIGIRQMVPFFGKLGLKEKIAQQEPKSLSKSFAPRRERLSQWSRWRTRIFLWRKGPSRFYANSWRSCVPLSEPPKRAIE